MEEMINAFESTKWSPEVHGSSYESGNNDISQWEWIPSAPKSAQ